MSMPLSELEVLKHYINAVMSKANHHALDINHIALAVGGAVIWRGNSLQALERDGELKNVLWFYVNESRFALTYQHEDPEQIRLLRSNLKDEVIAIFANDTPISEIWSIFLFL